MDKTLQKKDDQFARLGLGRVMGYASGGFAGCCIYLFTLSYISWFWTDFAGLPIAYVGIIMLVSKLFDGITDIIMGVIVDHTKSKHGKSRVWLLRMCIPYGILGVLTFTMPCEGAMAKVIYGGVMYTLMISFAYTALSVPYDSLISRITRNEYSQRQASVWRMLAANLPQLFTNTITIFLVAKWGYTIDAFTKVAIIFSVATVVFYLICYFSTKEIVTTVETESEYVPLGFKETLEGLKCLCKNKYWLLAIGMNFAFAFNTGVAGIYMYYYQYVMGDATLYASFSVAQIVPGCILMIFLPAILGKMKNRAKIVGWLMLLNCVLFIMQWMDPANVTKGLILMCIRSLCWMPFTGQIYAFLGQSVEYGEYKFGRRDEGLAFSASSFSFKVGSAIASGVFSLILGAAGYDGTLAQQSAAAIAAINHCTNGSLAILCILCAILLFAFNLEKKMPEIQEELKARADKKEALK